MQLSDEPRIFIYDNYPGGIGFSEPLFGMHAELLSRTRELIAGCACEHGCPTCVGPIGNTGPLAKVVALRILDLVIAGDALRTADSPRASRGWDAMTTLAERLRGVVGRTAGNAAGPPTTSRRGPDRARAGFSRLIRTSSPRRSAASGATSRASLPRGRAQVRARLSSRPRRGHGQPAAVAAVSPHRGACGARAPRRGLERPLLFLDLETPGLAGGAGTYAFLVGLRLVRRRGVPHAPVLSLELHGRACAARSSGRRGGRGGARSSPTTASRSTCR